jgi:hypothetical protein
MQSDDKTPNILISEGASPTLVSLILKHSVNKDDIAILKGNPDPSKEQEPFQRIFFEGRHSKIVSLDPENYVQRLICEVCQKERNGTEAGCNCK